eukprot:m.17542 g.17542  ORF g.17542 m.17542 type:complete len:258 (+) comp7155_c0_seq1:93-866(+)
MSFSMTSTVTHADVGAIVRIAQLVDQKSKFSSNPKCTLLRFVLQKSTTATVRSYLDEVVANARAESPRPALQRTISTAADDFPPGLALSRTISVDEREVQHEQPEPIDFPTLSPLTSAPLVRTQLEAPAAAVPAAIVPAPAPIPAPAATTTTTSAQMLPGFFLPAGAPLPVLPGNATVATPMMVNGSLVFVPYTPTSDRVLPWPQPQVQQQFVWTVHNTSKKKSPQQRRRSRSRSPSPTHDVASALPTFCTPMLVSA